LRAAFVLSPGEVVVEEVENPVLGEYDVLVRVRACGVCASDVKFFRGLKTYRETPFGRASPGFTGHEWVGEVVSIGSSVTIVKEGDRVTPFIINSCGKCKFCLRGKQNLCPEKRYIHGGFAEFVRVPERNLLKLPDDVHDEDACLIEPLACCINGVEVVRPRAGDTALIIGDGPMGLLNLQVLKTYGVRVIVMGHHDERLEKASELGADLTINSLVVDAAESVLKATDRYGADIVVLAVNNRDSLASALRLVSWGGRINIFAGAHPSYEIGINPNEVHYHEVTITGSADAPRECCLHAIEMVRRGAVRPSAIITHEYSLLEIKDAMEAAQKRAAIKIVVKP